jgi:superfamily II helicase
MPKKKIDGGRVFQKGAHALLMAGPVVVVSYCVRPPYHHTRSSSFAKALERYRKSGGPMTCKQCVAEAEEAERKAAAERRATKQTTAPATNGEEVSAAANHSPATSETRSCAACQKDLASTAFNRNQWAKGVGKSRCRKCVEQALKDEAAQQKESKQAAIDKARQDVEKAKAKGNAKEILKAESVLSSLEAEQVTGLKPVKMSGRGGRGRGRGAFSARGRGRSSKR